MTTYYWVGGTGNLNSSSNSTNYATTSGGSPVAAVTLTSADDLIFDGNSDTGGTFTVTINATAPVIRDLTISGLDQAMVMAGTVTLTIHGSLSLPATNLTWSASSTLTFAATSTGKTILTNGVTINGDVTFNGVGGGWTLQSALTLGSNDDLTLTAGTLDLAGYAVTCQNFIVSGSTTRTLTPGASTITCGGSTNAWNATTTTNFTLTASGNTSNIILSRSTAKSFAGGGLTYYILSQNGAGALTINGSNTFHDIQNPRNTVGAATITFEAGSTQTVTNFTATGVSGRILTLNSSSAGTAATLSKTSGTVSVDYMSISDNTAAGGASWYAGANSTNVTPSTNGAWVFTAPPSSGGTGNFFMVFG